MVAVRIPGTGKIIFVPKHAGEIVLDMRDYPDIDNSIKQEDIVVTGNWQDYTGSGTTTPSSVMNQGLANENENDLDMVQQNIRSTNFGDRGKRVATHRVRNKLIIIENQQ